MDELPPVADWRCLGSYAELHHAGRPGFAWEWLRRNSAYRVACDATKAGGGNEREAALFGLHRLEPYERGVPLARPIWRAEADPHVLRVSARPCAIQDSLDVRSWGTIATCHPCREGPEHWLFSDGFRDIRLDVVLGSLASGPVQLDYHISGLAAAWPQVMTLARLITMAKTGRMPLTLFRKEQRARRWTLVLRTADAIAAGATQRDIAEVLLGLTPGRRWRIANPSVRRRAQRLVEAVRKAINAEPRSWLGGDFP